jgi:hypothetical protein
MSQTILKHNRRLGDGFALELEFILHPNTAYSA